MPRNLIFDLGGLFISVFATRFTNWIELNAPDHWQLEDVQQGLIDLNSRFEQGLLTIDQFIDMNSTLLGGKLDKAEIEMAWKSILGSFALTELEWASRLRPTFRTVLLSNTNELHKIEFEKLLLMQSGGKTLSDYFDQVYFSHLLGMRKPDPNIFSTILALQDWNPEETLFVDDNELNLKGAAGIGIGTFLHKTNESVRFGFAPQLGMSLH